MNVIRIPVYDTTHIRAYTYIFINNYISFVVSEKYCGPIVNSLLIVRWKHFFSPRNKLAVSLVGYWTPIWTHQWA